MPARNEEDVIERCVRSCLDQTAKPYEIIVVNDGSTDRTREIVEGLMQKNKVVKLLNFESGHSAAFARNRGAEAAKGDIVYFLDADIIVEDRNFISKLEKTFQNEKVGAMLSGTPGDYKTFLQKCQGVRTMMSNLFFRASGMRINYVTGIRRKLFEEVGGFNEKIFYYEDRELGNRIASRMEIPMVIMKLRHVEPSTLSEIARQARYVGKGVSTYGIIKENPLVLVYPPYPFFWIVFIACVLLSFVNIIFLYILALLFLILIIEFIIASYISRMILPSLCFVFFISPLRAFLITYSFLRNKLKALIPG
ncbi:MAG: glycosyltransferase family 2 protein [Candidatus Micrarchaeota archaeon]|nr:glycosyltransferase family 2 protein [Candidatus Micrarchaeota archaeon]